MYLSKPNISKLTLPFRKLRIPASTLPTLYLPHYQSVTVTEPEHNLQALKAAQIGSGLRSTQQTGVQSCNRTKVEPQPACIDLRFQPELNEDRLDGRKEREDVGGVGPRIADPASMYLSHITPARPTSGGVSNAQSEQATERIFIRNTPPLTCLPRD